MFGNVSRHGAATKVQLIRNDGSIWGDVYLWPDGQHDTSDGIAATWRAHAIALAQALASPRLYAVKIDGDPAGGPCTLATFAAENCEADADAILAIAAMAPGQVYTSGGGAAPIWSVAPVAP